MFTLPIDHTHGWLAHNNTLSICRVRVGVHATLGSMCIMSEMPENPGVSITNGIESLIRSLVDTFEGVLDLKRTLWVEHYPQCRARTERFDRVRWDGTDTPQWERMDLSLTQNLIRQFGLKDTPWISHLACNPVTIAGAMKGVCRKEVRKVKAAFDRRLEGVWKGGVLPTLLAFWFMLADLPGLDAFGG